MRTESNVRQPISHHSECLGVRGFLSDYLEMRWEKGASLTESRSVSPEFLQAIYTLLFSSCLTHWSRSFSISLKKAGGRQSYVGLSEEQYPQYLSSYFEEKFMRLLCVLSGLCTGDLTEHSYSNSPRPKTAISSLHFHYSSSIVDNN